MIFNVNLSSEKKMSRITIPQRPPLMRGDFEGKTMRGDFEGKTNSFMSQVLPTCLAPLIMTGFRSALFFHSTNFWSSSLSIPSFFVKEIHLFVCNYGRIYIKSIEYLARQARSSMITSTKEGSVCSDRMESVLTGIELVR